MSAYEKHQFYVKPYDILEDRVIIPDQAELQIIKQLESGEIVNADSKEVGKIALVLSDKLEANISFYASISFLTVSEATSLRNQLNKVLEEE